MALINLPNGAQWDDSIPMLHLQSPEAQEFALALLQNPPDNDYKIDCLPSPEGVMVQRTRGIYNNTPEADENGNYGKIRNDTTNNLRLTEIPVWSFPTYDRRFLATIGINFKIEEI